VQKDGNDTLRPEERQLDFGHNTRPTQANKLLEFEIQPRGFSRLSIACREDDK
jgi:hypothetical protein